MNFDYLSYWRSGRRSIEKRQSFAQLTTVKSPIPGRLSVAMEVSGGHVVRPLAAGGEILNRSGKLPQQVNRGFAGAAATDVQDAIHSKLLVLGIAGVAEAVRGAA